MQLVWETELVDAFAFFFFFFSLIFFYLLSLMNEVVSK
uniref:Uncharacterized protein n=1 Tax=Rhizophora mucronata TaxID=61149 RepID=A0A2P2PYL4_RHIMU